MNRILKLFTAASLFLIACEKEETEPIIQVETLTPKFISATEATFFGRITVEDEKEISDHGFVYSTDPSPARDNPASQTVSLNTRNSGGDFNWKQFLLKPGEKYYVRAFLQDESRFIYGEELEFSTRIPEIQNIAPLEVSENDVITISGKNFTTDKVDVEVLYGDVSGFALTADTLQITSRVPSISADSVLVTLNIGGEPFTFSKFLKIKK